MPPSKLLNRQLNFIEREEYVQQIQSAFEKEDKQIVILSSFSGTGKSSVANQIGHIYNESSLSQLVYWMSSDATNLDEEFRRFAFDLKAINEEEKIKKPIDYIINQIAFKLGLNHKNEQFLFIFDNCDSIRNTQEYLELIMQDSALKNIKFLITTTIGSPFHEFDSVTQGKIKNCTQTIEIEPFDEKESINFVKSNLNDAISDETELNELISVLGLKQGKQRPVTLDKLIALLKLKLNSSHDFKALIEEFKLNKWQTEALNDELFENLIQKEEKAWHVLKNCSLLDPDFSPISVYTDLLGFDLDELASAKDILTKLSLITIEEDDEGMECGIRIHRTLQHDVKQYKPFSELNDNISRLHLASSFMIFAKPEKERNTWNKKKYYNNFKQIIDNSLLNGIFDQEFKADISLIFKRSSFTF